MNKLHTLLLFLGIALASGCATKTVSADDLYTLQSSCEKVALLPAEPLSSRVLKISKPTSTAAIRSRNLLYQQNELMQLPYAYSSWSDTPNNMLGFAFVSCAGKSDAFKSVLPSHSSARADFLLESSLLEFYHHINSDGTSEGRVSMEFYLIDLSSNEVIATRAFYQRFDARTQDARGGVEALNSASTILALELTQWLSSTVADSALMQP
ncbi:MAG: ABC-type transport auxiliary lipoprotein family protein [Gammaproteobacteria bacterium]|nr:ABC-type transport auxiliary lipoprotein family protein [Gammaproteobacteria bacterium]